MVVKSRPDGMTWIDLRSDTVTVPTLEMRRAAAEAEVGDDVCGEDLTVARLEARAAELLGKEAALFVPSGTFANQCAILTHADSGDEVILAERCHIVQHEAGAAALISRVQLRAASPASPHLLADDVRARIRPEGDIHYPRTGLICVEQATSDGTLTPLEELDAIAALGREHGIPIYMDGARIFNAAAALGVSPARVAAFADSVGFCLSKGLCAPVGSVLAGKRAFVDAARKNRKLMGGGMRQAGILAAPGLTALEDIVPRLGDDHATAKLLASLLSAIPGVELAREPEINMVFARLPGWTRSSAELVTALKRHDMRIYPDEAGVFRFVTHYYITEEDVQSFAAVLRSLLNPPAS